MVNCQNRLKSGGHGFKLYLSRRCSLHHCIRQKAARKNVDGLPTMTCMVSLYTASYMASLSLFELFGLSFARTGKNGDLIARASRKTSVPIVVKVPRGRQSKWPLGKPFLAKIFILDTESSLHVQELLAPSQKQNLVLVRQLCPFTTPLQDLVRHDSEANIHHLGRRWSEFIADGLVTAI